MVDTNFFLIKNNQTYHVRAPAKINVFLSVGEKREDKYHDITTLFQTVSLYDEITVNFDRPNSLSVVSGVEMHKQVASIPRDHNNLMWKARDVFYKHLQRAPEPMEITLRKKIAVGAGLAGGSADAAGMLAILGNRHHVSDTVMQSVCAEVGSDVPFSYTGGTKLGRGRGELLLPSLCKKKLDWVIVCLEEVLVTGNVYAELDRIRQIRSLPQQLDPSRVQQALAQGNLTLLSKSLHNDLQAAAISLMPHIRTVLEIGKQSGSLAGIVSGSGPTCIFLCSDAEQALDTASEISSRVTAQSIHVVHSPCEGPLVDQA